MDLRYTLEEEMRLERNRERAVSLVSGVGATEPRGLCLTLGRVVVDPVSGDVVPYEGSLGLESLFRRWLELFPDDGLTMVDGRLVGARCELTCREGATVRLSSTLGPGGQLEVSAGPSESVLDLLFAVETFDERFRRTCDAIGVEWQMVALGLDPVPTSPRDVRLVPGGRFQLWDEYLSRTGRYAQDMMRLSASTHVSLGYDEDEPLADQFRLAVALGPLVSFLCDNVSSWRGLSADDTPRMARSRVWEHVDPQRCAVVPGTFKPGFSAETYVDWVASVPAVMFTPDDGEPFSTGSATGRDVMALRDLSEGELLRLMTGVFPTVRLSGQMQIRDADSMPPRLAAALAAFLKGIFFDEDAFHRAYDLLVRGRTDEEVGRAYAVLRSDGWGASVYGIPVSTLVQRLVQLAENGLQDPQERTVFHALSSLWQAHLVPKDLYAPAGNRVAVCA